MTGHRPFLRKFVPVGGSLAEDLADLHALVLERMEGLDRFNHPYRYLAWVEDLLSQVRERWRVGG